MKTIILTLLMLGGLVAPGHCFANLGETIEQLDARYGKPSMLYTNVEGCASRRYRYMTFEISVAVLDGKSASESIVPLDTKAALSDVECLGLAKTLAGAETWSVLSNKEHVVTWHSGGFVASRYADPYSCRFWIEGPAYRDYFKALIAKSPAAQ